MASGGQGPAAGRDGDRLPPRPSPWARGCIDGSRSAAAAVGRPSVFARMARPGGDYGGRHVAIVVDNKVIGYNFPLHASASSPPAVEEEQAQSPSVTDDVHGLGPWGPSGAATSADGAPAPAAVGPVEAPLGMPQMPLLELQRDGTRFDDSSVAAGHGTDGNKADEAAEVDQVPVSGMPDR